MGAVICQRTINIEFKLIASGAFSYNSDVVPVSIRTIFTRIKIFLVTAQAEDNLDTVFLMPVRVSSWYIFTKVPVKINPGCTGATVIIVTFGNIGIVIVPGALRPQAN